VVTRPVPVEVPVQVPILPPSALLEDCEAPALPVEPPTYGEILRLLQSQMAALAECQARIEALREWRSNVEPNTD